MRALGFLAVAMVLGGCEPTDATQVTPVEGSVQAADGAFTIALPPGAILRRTPNRPEDFEVYVIERDGLELAFVYLGDAPKFPSVTLPGPLSPETDNPRTMTAANADGVERPIEFLWRTECDWPAYIHTAALGDDTAVTDEAAAIAGSVHPGRCP